MKNRRFLPVVLFLLMSGSGLYAQIGGLSGSKLISYTVDVVDDKKIEFEPSFYYLVSTKYWDNNHHLTDRFSTPDSLETNSGMGFRFTYGLWDKMEIGLSVTSVISNASIGLRYVVVQKEKYALAAMAGADIPLGSGVYNKNIRFAERALSAGAGVVGTIEPNQNLSVDLQVQYMGYLVETADRDKGGFYLSGDVGYYIWNHTFQLIGAANYSSIKNSMGNHSVVTLDTGFTVETGKNFIVVVGFPFDVYGKNEAKNGGFSFALTITLD